MATKTTTVTLGDLWGDRVKKRRAELGLSQTMFARLVGTTQQTISRIENGTLVPHDRMKVQIAQSCGSSVAEMFAWPEGRLNVEAA
jgi:DNA-binding XRE family transcriptional regulator